MKTSTIGTIDTAIPISLTEGIRWPALPSSDAVTYLAIAQQLEDSQWWPPEMLRRQQFEQLAELLAFAEQTIPFYRDRLRPAGFRADRRFTEEIWAQIPVLTMAELRAAGDAALGAEMPKEHGPVTRESAVARDGAALALASSTLSRQMANVFALREAQWDGRDLGGKLAIIAPASEIPAAAGELDDWGSPFREIYFTGPRVFLDDATCVADQAAWLEREQAELLVGSAAAIGALAQHLRKNNLKVQSLRHVRSSGQRASAATRRACLDVFGIRLFDGYASPVVGPIAYPCPQGEVHHVHAEHAVVDVVDESGRQCREGQVGRVVVTPLHNLAMPLIRLDIGDRAALGQQCFCGRGLPVLTEQNRG